MMKSYLSFTGWISEVFRPENTAGKKVTRMRYTTTISTIKENRMTMEMCGLFFFVGSMILQYLLIDYY